MSTEPELQTERLQLRRWRSADIPPCAAMNADRVVMEHFPSTQSLAETTAFVERAKACFQEHGYGLWVLELPGEAEFAGFVGLMPVDIDVPFAPSIEVGWRLARPFWGRGLATEASTAAITHGFEEHGLSTILALTAKRNLRSRRVMARLRMLRDDAEDFMHPGLPADHPLAPHVLYRTDRTRWRADTSR